MVRSIANTDSVDTATFVANPTCMIQPALRIRHPRGNDRPGWIVAPITPIRLAACDD